METRKHNRLKEFDYSQNGYYFITICTADKRKILCDISSVGASIARPPIPELSAIGRIVDNAVQAIPIHYPNASVDKYVIMPNHIHMILRIDRSSGHFGPGEQCSPLRSLQIKSASTTVSEIVRQMKGYITKHCGKAIWQKSFYDHVIRDEKDYLRIWEYIENNPEKWAEDQYFV